MLNRTALLGCWLKYMKEWSRSAHFPTAIKRRWLLGEENIVVVVVVEWRHHALLSDEWQRAPVCCSRLSGRRRRRRTTHRCQRWAKTDNTGPATAAHRCQQVGIIWRWPTSGLVVVRKPRRSRSEAALGGWQQSCAVVDDTDVVVGVKTEVFRSAERTTDDGHAGHRRLTAAVGHIRTTTYSRHARDWTSHEHTQRAVTYRRVHGRLDRVPTSDCGTHQTTERSWKTAGGHSYRGWPVIGGRQPCYRDMNWFVDASGINFVRCRHLVSKVHLLHSVHTMHWSARLVLF